MNEFVSASRSLAVDLIPILIAVVLICLIILLVNLIKIIKKAHNTMDKANTTIDLVDKTIDKVQAPIDTVVKVSKSVDTIHDETVECVRSAKKFVANNYDKIKEKIFTKESANEADESVSESVE